MKIKETAKNNIQITMNKQQAAALHDLLSSMSLTDITTFTKHDDDICELWHVLETNAYML